MDLTNRKGQWCIFKPSVFCQEGLCAKCQIAIDAGDNDPFGINILDEAEKILESKQEELI